MHFTLPLHPHLSFHGGFPSNHPRNVRNHCTAWVFLLLVFKGNLQETIIFTCHVSSLLKCLQLSGIIKCGRLKLHKNFLYRMERSKYVLKYFLSLNYDQLQTFFRQSLAFIYVLFILRGTRKEGKVVGILVASSQRCLCILQATEAVVFVTLFLALHHLGRESELSHTF